MSTYGTDFHSSEIAGPVVGLGRTGLKSWVFGALCSFPGSDIANATVDDMNPA